MDSVEHFLRDVDRAIDVALQEDIASGDMTTDAIFPPEGRCEATFQAREQGILAGLPIAERVFSKLDPRAIWHTMKQDGDRVHRPDVLARVEASRRAVLTGERVALNFLQRLSGIASLTRQYVEAVEGIPVKILDTRKTAPGLRSLEKYAVQVGGGTNHRHGLHDGILVKDNHIKLAGSITECLRRLKSAPLAGLEIEVETSTLEDVREALEAGADIIMLDNMSLEMMRKAVDVVQRRVILEASGGITLENVRAIAETGVDFISVGRLTHSAAARDITLEV